MKGILLYKGEITPEAFRGVKAEIDFLNSGFMTGINNVKNFYQGEEKKGLETLKRYISTGMFPSIVVSGLSKALEKADKNEHIKLWIAEHIEENNSPLIILIGEKTEKINGLKAIRVDTLEELRTFI